MEKNIRESMKTNPMHFFLKMEVIIFLDFSPLLFQLQATHNLYVIHTPMERFFILIAFTLIVLSKQIKKLTDVTSDQMILLWRCDI